MSMAVNQQRGIVIAILLLVFMAATRFHHFGSMLHLPDASWAIFFAVGFYLRKSLWLLVFLATAGLIDYLSISQFGNSSYCISPAYGFLLPAYASLWWGGRFFSQENSYQARSLITLAATVIVATSACYLISNGAFYWFSGHFEDANIAEYFARAMQYYPMFLKTTVGYVAAFTAVHLVLRWGFRDTATLHSS